MDNTLRYKVCFIFIVALVLRGWVVLTMPEQEKVLKHDDSRYEQIAISILNGEGFSKDGTPIAWRGPLYPYFIALVYRLCGTNPDIVRLIQIILGAGLCLVIYIIGKLVFSPQAGLLAAGFTAVYQPFIRYLYCGGPGYLYTEILYMLILSLAVWALLCYARAQSLKYMVSSGVLLCVSAMVKPTILGFFPFLFFWILHLKKFNFLKGFRDFLIISAVFFIVALPWTIRNYIVFKEFIFISNESGDVFIKGNHPDARGGVVWVDSELEKDPANLRKYSETYIKNAKYKEGLSYLFNNPRRIPYLFFKKFIVNWNFFGEDGKYNFCYGLALFLGITGIFIALRNMNAGIFLLLNLLFWPTLLALIFFGEPRYRYPAEPYLIVFAGYALHFMYSKAKENKVYFTVLIFFLAVNSFLYLFSDSVLGFLRRVIP